jgi:response regulator RpfG family c-di-GMP phosphodiesterase
MDLLESYRKVQNARVATILGLAKLAEYRDEGTGTHLERIREYAKMIVEVLAQTPKYGSFITPDYMDEIYQSSILHDIGKVGIPDAILLKPGKLSGAEFEIIKRHTILGGDAIKAIESQIEGRSFLHLGKEIAYNHHEKWDGSGYPRGLKGEDIPLSGRIVALADVYDALTTKRFYKEAYSHEKSKQIIISLKGIHFDPEVVEVFLVLENEFNKIREEKIKGEIELISQPVQVMGT